MLHVLFLLGLVCQALSQQVTIGVLRDFESRLRYANGNCSWRLTVPGTADDVPVDTSPEILVRGADTTNGIIWKCFVEDILQLYAIFAVYDIEDIPRPTSLVLDRDSDTLSWSHVFHPSDLPPEFEIVHEHNISYLVNVSDRDSGEREESLPSQETSLNISQFLDHCRRQKFSVQALVNGHFTQSSSYLTNSSAPVFQSLTPSLLVVADTVSILVLFVLEESQCLSQFTIVIDGLTLSLDVTSSHRESGQLNYDLSPHILAEDACSVRGVVYGSNDIGNSTTVDIGSPEGCTPTVVEIPSSVYLTHSTAYPTSSTPSTGLPTLTPTPRPKHPIIAVILPVCVVVILLLLLISIAIVVVLWLKKRNGGEYAVAKKESPGASHSDEEKQIPSEDTDDPVKPSRPAGLQYSEVEPSIGDRQKKFSIKPNSEYAQIDHAETEIAGQQCEQARAEAAEQESVEPASADVSIDPNVVGLSHYDLLLAALLVIKARWLDLGTNLDLSENFLDETETNMDTDRECLEEMLQNWLRYQEPSMEGLSKALTKMDLSPLIFDPAKKGFVFRSQDSGGGGGSTCS